MALRARRTHGRIGMALLVVSAVATALLPATAAHADPPHPPPTSVPPGAGWSASWHYEDPTDAQGTLAYSMRIPSVTLDGYGWDSDTTRDIGFSLTDTSPDPSLCAWLTVTGNDESYYWVACDGTVSATFHDTTPGDYTVVLQLRNYYDTWHETAKMILPSGSNDPELRMWPNHGGWEFLSPSVVHYSLQRPGAVIDGYATGWPTSTASTTTNASTCSVTAAYEFDYNPGTLGYQTACAGAPAAFAVTTLYGFKIMSCLTTGRTYRLPGIPMYGNRCVSLYIL
ncbi:hypothetical protein [Dactylosporangium sp. CA-092794]|uniref:hypothetical protein n=1 Tax=Dactylosporangium sp. CA-092794 TaxID=3239929 RepID=UPI003D92C7A0